MPFPGEADELGKPHPAAPQGAEGRANPLLAKQGASKQKAATYPASDFLITGGPRAKLDRLASAFHRRLGSLAHLQTAHTFSATGP